MEPASKRARVTDAQAQCSPSTVTSGSGFAPLTPMSDRGRSNAGSSEYSPVSDEVTQSKNRKGSRAAANTHPSVTQSQNARTAKGQDRGPGRGATHGPVYSGAHRTPVDDVVDSVFWTVLVSSKSD
jgi:hypothetical protein